MNEGYSYSLSVVTPPTVEPVTLAEVKAHSRIDIPDDDTWLTSQITVARKYVEEFTRRTLLNTTLCVYFDAFPPVIELPGPPASSVTSIKYYDTAGTLQTLAAAQYQTDFIAEPARIMPAYSCVWPTTRDQTFKAVQVTYVAGYGATASLVPEPLRHAILALVDDMYWHRGPTLAGTSFQTMPQVADHKMWPYRCFGY